MNLIEKIRSKEANICIVGAGYVGLPNAILFADKGFEVTALDVCKEVVNAINHGKSHIREKIIIQGLEKAHKNGLKAELVENAAQALENADVIVVSVPTPSKEKEPDLTHLKQATENISKYLNKEKIIIIESTVSPTNCRKVVKPILEKTGKKCGKDFYLAHCHERVNPGDVNHTIELVPRVVGGIDEKSSVIAEEVYKQVLDAQVIRVSNADTAELIKLVENTQRDINIAFVNEVALLCEKIGVNSKEVIDGASTKWNFYRVFPGPGVGGHCLPNNSYYLAKIGQTVSIPTELALKAREINDSMPVHVVELIKEAYYEANLDIKNSKIALLGIAYKSNIDDTRQSPSIEVVKQLQKINANFSIHDPFVNSKKMKEIHKLVFTELNKALESDCVVFLCGHDEYRNVNLGKIKAKIIIDAVGLFSKEQLTASGKVHKKLGIGEKLL